MYTAEAEPIVTCIIDEAILELQQIAFFVKKQAIESAACREPPRASRTRPDAAALCSCSQDVLNRTVCCIFP